MMLLEASNMENLFKQIIFQLFWDMFYNFIEVVNIFSIVFWIIYIILQKIG